MYLFCSLIQNPIKKPAKEFLFTKAVSWKTEILQRELLYNFFSKFQSRITFCRTIFCIDKRTSQWLLLKLFVHSEKRVFSVMHII